MSKYSNIQAVPLSLQVFLANDSYDHNSDPTVISVTSLIKPVRQLILSSRLNHEESSVDLTQMVASRLGTAIHDGIEKSWSKYKEAMTVLGYPQKVIDRVVINKPVDQITEEDFPIYFEQRTERKVGKYTVSGKFDFVENGMVEDFKTTSTFTFMNGKNDEKYRLQLSIYRWLNPKMITDDRGAIQFIFTDWSAIKAQSDPKYPQSRIQRKYFDLLSLTETSNYITKKIRDIEFYFNTEESSIPECSDEDLWRSDPVFKYYKDPTKTARSTKNFDNKQDAYTHLAIMKVGTVIEKPGSVTSCRYCSAFSLCTQKDRLIASGELTV